MKKFLTTLLLSVTLVSSVLSADYKGTNIDNIFFRVFGYNYKHKLFFDGYVIFKDNKAVIRLDADGKIYKMNLTTKHINDLSDIKLYDPKNQTLVVIALIKEQEIEDTTNYECNPVEKKKTNWN